MPDGKTSPAVIGLYLALKPIHNVGTSWKLMNPDHRTAGVRIQWEGQLAK